MRALLRTGMSLPEQKEADTVLHTQLDIHNTCTGIFSVLSWSTFFYLNLQKKRRRRRSYLWTFSTLLPEEKSKKCSSPRKPWSSIWCLLEARAHPPQPIRKPCPNVSVPPSPSAEYPPHSLPHPTLHGTNTLGCESLISVTWKQSSRLSGARSFRVLKTPVVPSQNWALFSQDGFWFLRLQSHRQLSDLGADHSWMPPLLSGSAVQAALSAPLPCIHTSMWPGMLFKSFFIQSCLPALD